MSDVLRRIVKTLASILGVPEIDDGPALRAFIQKVFGWLGPVLDWTPPKWDDKLLEVAQKLVANDATWAIIFGFIADRFGPSPPMNTAAEPLATELAGQSGFDFDTVLEFVIMLLDILTALWGDND